ncbi:MAG TPA: response regulator transcription factor [Tepidiformaceae bacterium]|nr:response regulator transcription factor [Tepidiformaceae bacterium]
MKRIRVLLVDDEPRIRKGLAMRLAIEPDLEIVGEAEDGAPALTLTRELDPDVVLMDLNMNGMDGMTATRALRAEAPDRKVIVLTLHDDPATRREAADAGAGAFVGKQEGSTRLVTVIRELHGAA